MLVSQQARSKTARSQGRPAARLAELRDQLGASSGALDDNRQRLHELAQRVSAVQALGDEYARVELSEYAAAALGLSVGQA